MSNLKHRLLVACASCAGGVCLTPAGLECEQVVVKGENVPQCGITTLYNQAGDLQEMTDDEIEDVKPHLVNGEWIPAKTIIEDVPETTETVETVANADVTPIPAKSRKKGQ